MSARRRIKGDMRARLDELAETAAEIERSPGLFEDSWGCWLKAIGLFAAALVILGGLYMAGVIDYDFTQTPEERAASQSTTPEATDSSASGESPASGGPAAENPTAVGQAVDAIARPAIEDVYGDAQLMSAPSNEAPIVSLQYGIPANPTAGDGEKLRNALANRGARVDPANSEMDYHAGEEFMMLIDTGNPAYKSIRVSISPDLNRVFVNADRSE